MLRGAVLGFPISHSLSPTLHNAAFTFLNLPAEYQAIEVASGTLQDFIADRSDDFDYLSLTMPLKEEALSLDVKFSDLALRIESVNTLFKRDGRWCGESTDGSGFRAALEYSNVASCSRALILGAGGTARAVAGALDGFADSIAVLGRTSTRRDALQHCVVDSDFEYLRWEDDFDLASFDCVINTTPAGAADLLADYLPDVIDAVLFDVIYKPWPTILASRWSDHGGQVINGKELLLWQGIDQFALVLDKELDREGLSQYLRPLLAQG